MKTDYMRWDIVALVAVTAIVSLRADCVLPAVQNGAALHIPRTNIADRILQGSLPSNSLVHVVCDSGHVPSGPVVLVCQRDRFNGEVPSCVKDSATHRCPDHMIGPSPGNQCYQVPDSEKGRTYEEAKEVCETFDARLPSLHVGQAVTVGSILRERDYIVEKVSHALPHYHNPVPNPWFKDGTFWLGYVKRDEVGYDKNGNAFDSQLDFMWELGDEPDRGSGQIWLCMFRSSAYPYSVCDTNSHEELSYFCQSDALVSSAKEAVFYDAAKVSQSNDSSINSRSKTSLHKFATVALAAFLCLLVF